MKSSVLCTSSWVSWSQAFLSCPFLLSSSANPITVKKATSKLICPSCLLFELCSCLRFRSSSKHKLRYLTVMRTRGRRCKRITNPYCSYFAVRSFLSALSMSRLVVLTSFAFACARSSVKKCMSKVCQKQASKSCVSVVLQCCTQLMCSREYGCVLRR